MSFIFRSKRPKDIWTILKEYYRQLNAAKFKGGTSVETRDFTPQGRSNESTIIMATRYRNTQQIIVNAPGVKLYRLPREPDGTNLVLWNMCRFVGAEGNRIRDDSDFENHGQIFGSTTRTVGHIDGLDAVSANGVSDYYRIPNDGLINTLGGFSRHGAPMGPGTAAPMTSMSGSCWFKPNDISLAGGKPRVIASKVDLFSSTQGQLNGWSLTVESDGTIWFAYKQGNTLRARPATRMITQMGIFYFLGWVITSIGGATPTVRLFVNAVESTEQTSTTKAPVFPTFDAGLDLFVNGTDEGNGIGRVNGATGDLRLWRNLGLVTTDFQNQFNNKYTISDIEYVARAGDAYVAVEGEQGGGEPGEQPNPPPSVPVAISHSALSYSPDSHTIDELNINAPGGMGVTGGTGGADPAIPAQLFDSFRPNYWSLTTLNQNSPDNKWELINLPGTGGFVRTESYQHPGEQSASNILRIKFGTGTPVVKSSTAKFAEFYARYTIRTITRNNTNEYSAGHFMFKYVDVNNFAYLVLRPSNIEVRKVQGGVDSLIATGPTRSNVFQPGSIHTIEMWLYGDGQFMEVVADNDAAATKLTVGSHAPGTGALDPILSAVAPMAFRASSCDCMIDDFLVRPMLSDGWEKNSPWSLTTAGAISPTGKWRLSNAPLSDGVCATTTTGGGVPYNHILRLRHGFSGSILNSQTTFTNLLMEFAFKTTAVLIANNAARARAIFKWKDNQNLYYFLAYPTGWGVYRILNGVSEARIVSTANGLADNAGFDTGTYKILVTNGGLDFEIWKGSILLYKEEFGLIKVNATGSIQTETIHEDDGGLLAGPGRVGFWAEQCDINVAYVSVFPT